jgi:hypothetical protein
MWPFIQNLYGLPGEKFIAGDFWADFFDEEESGMAHNHPQNHAGITTRRLWGRHTWQTEKN